MSEYRPEASKEARKPCGCFGKSIRQREEQAQALRWQHSCSAVGKEKAVGNGVGQATGPWRNLRATVNTLTFALIVMGGREVT